MSCDTWFIAWVTLTSLLHAFLLAPELLHVFMSHDTWFIAWIILELLHVFLLTFEM